MNKYRILLLCATLLLFSATDLFAQGALELETVIPGTPARGIFVPNDSSNMDFNGDGTPDLVLLQPDAGNETASLHIAVDPSDPSGNTIFELSGNNLLDFSRASVVGFYEFDTTNDLKEIVIAEKLGRRFVNPVIVDADGNLLSVWDDTDIVHLLTISNMDADITEEVVIFNPAYPRVEVWGAVKR